MFNIAGSRTLCAASRPRTAVQSAKAHTSGSNLRRTTSLPCRRSISVAAQALPETGCSKAWDLLQEYTTKEFQGLAQPLRRTVAERDRLRDALQTVLAHKNSELGWDADQPEVLLGILCSDVRLGIRALRDWSAATGTQFVVPASQISGVPLPAIKGPVYIKFNSATRSCYVSKYEGQDRGVLLHIGQVQLGHFPLGLWDEQQSVPAPKL